LFLIARPAIAADPRPRIIAFASENWLTVAVGTFTPGKKGWTQATDSFKPPAPTDLFTLFGNTGKLGEVAGKDERRADAHWIPIEWRMRIDRGDTIRQPFALAIQGSWPEDAVLARELPLDDPAAVSAVSKYLKEKGLKVESPFLTQAYEVDLAGDGQLEKVVCAHSDMKAIVDNQPAAIYAVALIISGPPGKEKMKALAKQCSFKPASQSIEEHEHFYGTRDFYRIIAIHDIDGDGAQEIALYRAKIDATQIDVFTFHKGRPYKALSVDKFNYN